ncbi:lipid A deacylase LpxR family protein [Flavobacterium sp. WC2509]|uniref:lipid A deacylase LpxR family protein n=1 Tax=Flavobacterium sp. WC2509 TaxID=3461406 RepID=UPI004044AAA7
MKTFGKILFLLLLSSSSILAQIRTKELGMITDNDSYTSSRNDRYYTNGLTFFYRYLGKTTDTTIAKKTNDILLGQYIYTPRFLNPKAVDKNDRPFAGYLFTGFEKSFFYTNQNVLKIGLQIGTIGPNSYAKEVQYAIHQMLTINKPSGWENQIHNALALQSHFMFSKKLFPKAEQKTIDFNWQSEADLGTIFTRISTGLVTRIGFKKLLPISNSNLYGASVGTTKGNNNEFYFYMAPSIRYQIYDATIQGSLFNDDSPVTFPVVPLRFNAKAGFVYRKNNFNLSYSFIFTSKEVADSPSISFFYGSIGLSFLLR